jgi:hypothetical protein
MKAGVRVYRPRPYPANPVPIARDGKPMGLKGFPQI